MEWIWIATAFLLGWLGNRLSLPPLVGYLFAGLALHWVGFKANHNLVEISHAGVLLLLFTVGLKLRWRSLVRREVLGGGGLHLAIFGLLATAVLLGIGTIGFLPATVLGVGIALSSTVFAVKALESRNEIGSIHGRIAVGILVLQDLLAVGLLAVAGEKHPSIWALSLLGLLLLQPLASWLIDQSGHQELLLVFGIGVALASGALSASVGVSAELGALLAGTILSGHDKAGELSKILWSVKELFLVAFFLLIGLSGFPNPEQWVYVFVLLAALALKAALFFWLFVRFGLRVRTAILAAASLSTHSEFALITTSALAASKRIDAFWIPVLAMSVLFSLAIAGPLNRHIHTLCDRWEPRLRHLEKAEGLPDLEPTDLGNAEWAVIGMGRTGGGAYKALESALQRVIGLDVDQEKVATHRAKQRNVIYADVEDPALWSGLDMSNLKGVLLTMPDYEAKLRAIKGLRQHGCAAIIGATTYHWEEDQPLVQAGANFIFHPFSAAGERLAESALAMTRVHPNAPKPSDPMLDSSN